MPGGSPGHPKSRQIRCRETPGTPRGAQERPEGVLGRSRERLGASPASPESAQRVPKGGSVRQRGRPGAPGSSPKHPKSTLSRVRKRKRRVFSTRRVRGAVSNRFFAVYCRFSVFRNVCEPSEVPRLPAKSRVRPFARRVESLARRSLEKPRKSTRKSTRNRRKSMLRRAWAPEGLEKRT